MASFEVRFSIKLNIVPFLSNVARLTLSQAHIDFRAGCYPLLEFINAGLRSQGFPEIDFIYLVPHETGILRYLATEPCQEEKIEQYFVRVPSQTHISPRIDTDVCVPLRFQYERLASSQAMMGIGDNLDMLDPPPLRYCNNKLLIHWCNFKEVIIPRENTFALQYSS